MSLKQCQDIQDTLSNFAKTKGLEVHMFNISWYNEVVGPKFKLPCPPNTLAFVIISQPSMFEKAFVPYINSLWAEAQTKVDQTINKKDFNANGHVNISDSEQDIESTEDDSVKLDRDELKEKEISQLFFDKIKRDPLDQCMQHVFQQMTSQLVDHEVDATHDYELTPTRRPKILVQTAGHVAGAVCMYRAEDIEGCDGPWPGGKKVFPVCLHPEFGGWFALRGVVVLPRVICSELLPPPQRVILTNKEDILELLKRYNGNWQDYSFRDIIPVKERYSDQQKKYFSTLPKDRAALLLDLVNKRERHTAHCSPTNGS